MTRLGNCLLCEIHIYNASIIVHVSGVCGPHVAKNLRPFVFRLKETLHFQRFNALSVVSFGPRLENVLYKDETL